MIYRKIEKQILDKTYILQKKLGQIADFHSQKERYASPIGLISLGF
jgi:hypothetical protein